MLFQRRYKLCPTDKQPPQNKIKALQEILGSTNNNLGALKKEFLHVKADAYSYGTDTEAVRRFNKMMKAEMKELLKNVMYLCRPSNQKGIFLVP